MMKAGINKIILSALDLIGPRILQLIYAVFIDDDIYSSHHHGKY